MKNIGIDLGSRYVKMVKADGEKIEFERFDTVSFYKQFIKRDGDNTYIDVDKLGIDKDYTITATGYGRNLMSFSNAEIISEIKGFRHLHFGGERTYDRQKHHNHGNAVQYGFASEIVFRNGVSGDDLRSHAKQRH